MAFSVLDLCVSGRSFGCVDVDSTEGVFFEVGVCFGLPLCGAWLVICWLFSFWRWVGLLRGLRLA